jgi:serine/threonine-protein kinase
MRRTRTRFLAVALATCFLATALPLLLQPSLRAADLAQQARAVLDANCFRCHGKDGSKEGGMNYILDAAQLVKRKKITPGDPAKSKLFQRVTDADDPMPPKDEKPRPSKDDIAVLESWIKAGALAYVPPPPAVARTFLTEKDVYQAMFNYLSGLNPAHTRFQRFFTLTHLHNNPAVSDSELRLARAALSKLLNSLSWRRAIVWPKPIDKDGAVLAFDLRDLDWDLGGQWNEVLRVYPYGLTHDQLPAVPGLAGGNGLAAQVYKLTASRVPAVRIDWFVAHAAQPPLYHTLLKLPATAGELEKQLRVDVQANFARDRLARAAFIQSGVSNQNRLVERHEAAYGAYWKSYDFKTNEGSGDLRKRPLGPVTLFKKHPFKEQAFEHAGGEIIFNLPNGLQGYLLVNGKDERINDSSAVPDVVRDKNEFAGNSTIIVNGLSCMACHKQGMLKDFQDVVRDSRGLGEDALDKVRRLYPPHEEMEKLVNGDEELFMSAAEKATGRFLKVGPDENRNFADFGEPISVMAARHLKTPVRVEEAALELGLADAKDLQAAIKANSNLESLGLGQWLNGGVINRKSWEERKGVDSAFQETARELKRGLPINPQ